MSTTNNLSPIEEKKQQDSGTKTTAKPLDVIKYAFKTFLYVFFYILVGSFALYTCKIAQAGVLPLEVPFPTTNNEPIDINFNVIKKYDYMGFGWLFGQKPSEIMSMKVNFDTNLKFKDSLLGKLNAYKTDPNKANFFGLYASDVLNNVMITNNWITTYIYDFMNAYFSESVILLLWPYVSLFYYMGLFFANWIVGIFYTITNLGDFFKQPNQQGNEMKWKQPTTYLQVTRIIALFCYCLFYLFIGNWFVPILTTMYSIFAPLLISGKIKETNNKMSWSKLFFDIFKYKSQLVMFIFTYMMISGSTEALGEIYTTAIVIATLIGLFAIHLFNQYIPVENKDFTPGLALYDAFIQNPSVINPDFDYSENMNPGIEMSNVYGNKVSNYLDEVTNPIQNPLTQGIKTQGTNALTQGTNAFTQGTNALAQGTNALTQGTNAFTQGTNVLTQGTNASVTPNQNIEQVVNEAPTEGTVQLGGRSKTVIKKRNSKY
jgi:hypothetical protein